MSRQRLREIIPYAAFAMAFSAGVAWASQTAKVSALDERVSVLDTAKVGRAEYAKRQDSVLVELHAIHMTGDSNNARLRQIWCAGKSDACR